MSKFRARQLDASKPIPIYLQEDILDYAEFNNVTNRTVPQLPTGMEKDEETEHHLQQAIFHHRVIPVPEVFDTMETEKGKMTFDKLYPPNFKQQRQLIHIHPFSADQDIPDYDMDSEDEEWLRHQADKGELLPLDPLQFEEMMDRLEKASGLKAVTLQEAKLLLKDDDDLITAVYDYWLNKRLGLQYPLIPVVYSHEQVFLSKARRHSSFISSSSKVSVLMGGYQVRTEKCMGSTPNDPYVAFRKRTEKMQTRKNRKNDETSYEKMLKLKRDLVKAVTLLDMVKRREKAKRELLHLNVEIFEKRYNMEDFSGTILEEVNAQRIHNQRAGYLNLLQNHQYSSVTSDVTIQDGASMENGSDSRGLGVTPSWLKVSAASTVSKSRRKEEGRRERRTYKKRRRHFAHSTLTPTTTTTATSTLTYTHPPDPYAIASVYPHEVTGSQLCSEEEVCSPSQSEEEDYLPDGVFTFRRKPSVQYLPIRRDVQWAPPSEGWGGPSPPQDPRYHYCLTSLSYPSPQYVGVARRRVGRGGRVWLDRLSSFDEKRLKSVLRDGGTNGQMSSSDTVNEVINKWPCFQPSSLPLEPSGDADTDVEVDVETVGAVSMALGSLSSETVSVGPSEGEQLLRESSKEPVEGLGGSSLPSSILISAEMLEGPAVGAVSQLQVSLPLEVDAVTSARSSPAPESEEGRILLEKSPLDISLIPTLSCEGASSANTSGSGASEPVALSSWQTSATGSSGSDVVVNLTSLPDNRWTTLTCTKTSNGHAKTSNDGRGSPLHTKNNVKSTLNPSLGSVSNSRKQHSISIDFSTQPSSKFLMLDSANSFSLSSSQDRSSSPLIHSSVCTTVSSPSLSFTSSSPSSSQSSSNLVSSLNFSEVVRRGTLNIDPHKRGNQQSSEKAPTVTSLCNSLLLPCNSVNLDSKSSSENQSVYDINTKSLNKVTSALFIQSSPKDKPLDSLAGGIILPNTKNNGNGVLPNSSNANNLVSQRVFAWKRRSLSPSESILSASETETKSPTPVLSNGPQNSLENTKCQKVNQYICPEI